MWIQLKSKQYIEKQGTQKTYHVGDWVDVGKFLALKLIESGQAHIPNQEINGEYLDYTAGIAVLGNKLEENTRKQIETTVNKLSFAFIDKPELPFSETMIYDSSFTKIRPELIGIGFYWLQNFEVIAPIFDYEQLAIHIGSDNDRRLTKEVVEEMRIPVYDDKLLFVRRSEKTKALIKSYNDFRKEIKEPKLALLCAIYEHKPLLLPMPTTWMNRDR